MNTQTDCPCGSGKSYAQCCLPYHLGENLPPTAEALMRSRFSAFCLQNEGFLLATWDSSQRPAAIDFSGEQNQWLKLEIIGTKKGGVKDHKALVTFKAHYLQDNEAWIMIETSRFVKTNNRWFYLNGLVTFAKATEQPEVQNRNALCACGSGKKFKRCCGTANS
ncbi:MAG: YchJ family protein [Methylovulum sp.]|nr:YchJ family protein [Methylovulum sp.]